MIARNLIALTGVTGASTAGAVFGAVSSAMVGVTWGASLCGTSVGVLLVAAPALYTEMRKHKL